ncbi:SH3 domain-containing protein [Christensenella sp. MSJ-20]|uniref:dockerin type I domain-containing protein n=1 Tax=Christensenella sp. MSJ-20 TaxID=2841518 RepID=UPI001C7690D3|nr:SH3 domain-containing protein [Christensenella sp. MSJ-20]
MKKKVMQQIGMRICGFLLCVALLAVPALLQLEGFTAEAAGYKVGLIQVTDTPVNIRSGPGTNYDRVGTLSNARLVYVKSEKVNGSWTWYQIALSADAAPYGWIREDLLACVTTVEADPAFDQYLQSQGFPRSYWDNLRVLHAIYPNWKFEAFHTGLQWTDVLAAETNGGINVVHPDYLNYGSKYIDTTNVDGTGELVKYDTGWYKASKDLVAYYLDPRNFLDDIHIFQMEKLTFESNVHSASNLGYMLKNTFMDGSYSTTIDGKFYKYEGGQFSYSGGTTTFQQAIFDLSKKNNVNPYHVAARIRQEMGPSGVSPLGWGAVSGYLGIYNFFNIGAYTTDEHGANENGAIYAKNAGWTDPYKALDGGIRFLGKNYIAIGQDTLYLQKFDVVGPSYYDHQYMTNVMAPTSEANTTGTKLKNSFGSSFTSQPFAFRIPVYLNMPENAVENPASSQYVPSSNLVTDSIIASETYLISGDGIITGVAEGTEVSTLTGGIKVVMEGGVMHLFDASGNEKTSGKVVTGDRLQVWNSNGDLQKEYGIVIYGDASGDGVITVLDLLRVQKQILGTIKLEGSYLKAADVSRNGTVDVLDLLRIQKHILGSSTITQK